LDEREADDFVVSGGLDMAFAGEAEACDLELGECDEGAVVAGAKGADGRPVGARLGGTVAVLEGVAIALGRAALRLAVAGLPTSLLRSFAVASGASLIDFAGKSPGG
jgi:hypothetical protein